MGNCPAPVSPPLYKAFYPTSTTIAKAVLALLGPGHSKLGEIDREDHFMGPY